MLLVLMLLVLLGGVYSLRLKKMLGNSRLGGERVSQTVLCILWEGRREGRTPFLPARARLMSGHGPQRALHDITPHPYRMRT